MCQYYGVALVFGCINTQYYTSIYLHRIFQEVKYALVDHQHTSIYKICFRILLTGEYMSIHKKLRKVYRLLLVTCKYPSHVLVRPSLILQLDPYAVLNYHFIGHLYSLAFTPRSRNLIDATLPRTTFCHWKLDL